MSDRANGPIRAAGGVIVRGDSPATAKVAVVHRPKYDDWTIPKGKLDPGEETTACAVREVAEETGLHSRITGHAGTAKYRVAEGEKVVEYFWMRPFRSAGFRPNEEVDEMRWVALNRVGGLLSYDFDRHLVTELDVDAALAHTTIHLVRHGSAGDRRQWDGPDHERPLNEKGLFQAEMLGAALSDVGVERLLSSPYVRCMQTLEPLGATLGVEVERTDALAEGAGASTIARLLDEIGGSTAVLCSHGDVIPDMLKRLHGTGVRFLSPYECKKGSTWVVGHDGKEYTEARYVPPPSTQEAGSPSDP